MPVWMGWVAVAGLSLFLALYIGLAALIARRLAARLVPLALIFAGLFALAEIGRGLLFTGFAWNPMGAGWLQLPGVAQLAALVGANGLSALAVIAGGSLAALIAARGEAGRLPLILVFPLLLGIGLGVPRIQKPLPPPTGAKLLLGVVDVRAEPKTPWTVVCRPARLEALLGLSASPEEIAKVLLEVSQGCLGLHWSL